MKDNLHIFKSPKELANQFANELMNLIESHSGETFHLAISGGKTPDLLFSVLAEKYADSSRWQKVHFWWVDERMVPPVHPESNFGVVQKLLFSKITVPEKTFIGSKEKTIRKPRHSPTPDRSANCWNSQTDGRYSS